MILQHRDGTEEVAQVPDSLRLLTKPRSINRIHGYFTYTDGSTLEILANQNDMLFYAQESKTQSNERPLPERMLDRARLFFLERAEGFFRLSRLGITLLRFSLSALVIVAATISLKANLPLRDDTSQITSIILVAILFTVLLILSIKQAFKVPEIFYRRTNESTPFWESSATILVATVITAFIPLFLN